VYVVLAGSFVVLQDQQGLPPKVINRCSTGDSFGEIGPLAGVPRTASVMADAAGEILRIPGPSFVAAVNGNALGAGGSAVAGIVTRAAAPPSPPPGPHDAPTRPG
jgi:CRP-like cAMP-binding protein